MFRRTHYAIAAAVLAVLPLAHAASGPAEENRVVEPAQTIASVPAVAETAVAEPAVEVVAAPIDGQDELRAGLAALFQPQEGVVETAGGVAMTPTPEVLLARIGPDGEVVMVCVDSEEAAVRFLRADRLPAAGRAQEK